MTSGRTLHLNAFIQGVGHHEAAWRHPGTEPDRLTDVTYFQQVAGIAEDGLLDSVFFADALSLTEDVRFQPVRRPEPLTLLPAIAVATERIGLIATASTTYTEPYNLARQFASIDHISGGRAGWNVVTSSAVEAAYNYGYDEQPGHHDRYLRAEEFLEVATRLWDSWEDDAVLGDRATGRYADPAKVHEIRHAGKHFRVRGPLAAGPPGARAGRIVARRQGLRRQARRGRLHRAAEPRRRGRLRHRPTAARRQVRPGPVGPARPARAEPGHLEPFIGDGAQSSKSRRALVADIVRGERPTLRGLLRRLAGARGHRVLAGTPEQLADQIQTWYEAGAADGFNIMAPYLPGGLRLFVDQVVPELQRRGLFRTAYEGSTLRDHYRLPRPDSTYAQGEDTV